MTPEQRIICRINREIGGWPENDWPEGMQHIVSEEIVNASEKGEIPRLGEKSAKYPIRVFFYGGNVQVVFSGSTFPYIPKEARVEPDKNLSQLNRQMAAIAATVALILLTIVAVQIATHGCWKSVALLATMTVGYGASAVYFWKIRK